MNLFSVSTLISNVALSSLSLILQKNVLNTSGRLGREVQVGEKKYILFFLTVKCHK